MSADKLCSGVNNDVCTIFDRSYQIRCSESVVNDQRDFVLVRNSSYSFDIYDIRVWISKCLDENCLGVALNCSGNCVVIEDVNECSFDSVLRQCVSQQIVGAALDVLR